MIWLITAFPFIWIRALFMCSVRLPNLEPTPADGINTCLIELVINTLNIQHIFS